VVLVTRRMGMLRLWHFGHPIMTDPNVEECDYCNSPSRWYLHGAWTIFDWFDMQVCDTHLEKAVTFLYGRRVDGYLPIEITWRQLDA